MLRGVCSWAHWIIVRPYTKRYGKVIEHMTRYRFMFLIFMLPAVALAGTNPFGPTKTQYKTPPPTNLFVASPKVSASSLSYAGGENALPPPIPSFKTLLSASSSTSYPALPSRAEAYPPKNSRQNCSLKDLPQIPTESYSGGQVLVKLSRKQGKCILGMESENSWIRIGFLNNKLLRLRIAQNKSGSARSGTLIFASINSSQQLTIHQNGTYQGTLMK